MLGWITRWWHARQRRIDLDILWPQCLANARDLDHAKAAFAMHAMNDPAWLELGEAGVDVIDRLGVIPHGGFTDGRSFGP